MLTVVAVVVVVNWDDLGHSGAHESRGLIEYEDIELDIWVMAFIWDVSAYSTTSSSCDWSMLITVCRPAWCAYIIS